ncbi:MAG TPA: PH domain-containing protein, partial [Nocardioidaceae bacterium]
DQRLITRRGALRRRGHDIPLGRISDVSHARGLLDRVLGCGTLVVSVEGERRVELDDIPQVEQVHLRMQDLLHDGVVTEAFRREPDGRR